MANVLAFYNIVHLKTVCDLPNCFHTHSPAAKRTVLRSPSKKVTCPERGLCTVLAQSSSWSSVGTSSVRCSRPWRTLVAARPRWSLACVNSNWHWRSG
jgi:hypothetical protein